MGWSEGGKWDNCNSIINKYIKKFSRWPSNVENIDHIQLFPRCPEARTKTMPIMSKCPGNKYILLSSSLPFPFIKYQKRWKQNMPEKVKCCSSEPRAKLARMQDPSWDLLWLATLWVSWILLRTKAPFDQLSRQMVMPLIMAFEQWAGSLWVERAVALGGGNFILCNSLGHFQRVGSIDTHPYNDLDFQMPLRSNGASKVLLGVHCQVKTLKGRFCPGQLSLSSFLLDKKTLDDSVHNTLSNRAKHEPWSQGPWTFILALPLTSCCVTLGKSFHLSSSVPSSVKWTW